MGVAQPRVEVGIALPMGVALPFLFWWGVALPMVVALPRVGGWG